jgi:hypothetical protein
MKEAAAAMISRPELKVRLIGGLSGSWYQPRQIVAFETADLQIGEDIRWLAAGRYEIWSLPIVKICQRLRSSVSKNSSN